jgi:hypothetical protein
MKTKGVADNLLVAVEISWLPLVGKKLSKRVLDI